MDKCTLGGMWVMFFLVLGGALGVVAGATAQNVMDREQVIELQSALSDYQRSFRVAVMESNACSWAWQQEKLNEYTKGKSHE